jgi:ATP-dependent helicase/DNAse subunit B
MADGKTVGETEVLYALDQTLKENDESTFIDATRKGDSFKNVLTKEELQSYVNYALAVCEKGAEQMLQGVIVPSPYTETCKYCAYKGICLEEVNERSVGKVDKFTICDALKEEK